MTNMEQFKPVITGLIQYYYGELDNIAGGHCHIVLDDGNLSDENLSFCQASCLKNDDKFGYFIMAILHLFPEEKREKMYLKNHWGMADQP